MTEKKIESKLVKKSEENREFVEKEKNKFIKNFLKSAEQEFKEYNEGYKIFSITTGKPVDFSLDNKMVSNIVNYLTLEYQCELVSTSQSFIPPKNMPLYTLEFFKK